MNNYQLTNTSVYLSGQCKWDIILGENKNGELEVTGFNLSPISDFVPFNKKLQNSILNYNHSDNLKTLYNNIKESFWDVTPRVNSYSRYDGTYLAGMKRASECSVYNKQFEYLQPVWIEKIDDGHFLKFDLIFYFVNSDGSRGDRIIHKELDLCFNEDSGKIHNDFIKYFYDWITYLNIYKTGNNKVFNVSFDDSTAAIDGVNVTTGQRVGKISVDEIVHNIFQQERPLMESDYIFSTLFKSHDMVTSQLFNFNFCFDTEDVLPSFIIASAKGLKISADCVVKDSYEGIDNKFESRYLFSNYEYIKKYSICPYASVIDTEFTSFNNTITENYEYEIKDDFDYNVLNYLKDYNDKSLQYKNKLIQPIIHWMYCNDNKKTFNIYNGFQGCTIEPTNEEISSNENEKVKYKSHIYDIQSSNEIQVIDFPSKYIYGRGDFDWLYPGKLMTVDKGNVSDQNDIERKFRILLSDIGRYMNVYINYYGLSLQKSINYWGGELKQDNSDLYKYNILFLYVNPDTIQDLNSYIRQYNLYTNILYDNFNLLSDSHVLVGYKSKTFIIISDDKNKLILNSLEKLNYIGSEYSNNFRQLLSEIKTNILNHTKGNYIGFEHELIVSIDETGSQSFYKSDDHTTFLYRNDGDLCPCMISDLNRPNYNYILENGTNQIIKIEDLSDIGDVSNIPEIKWTNGGWCVSLYKTLNFEFIKGTDDMESIKNIIKEEIANTYNLDHDDVLIDYIYNLYDRDIKFEYVSETNINEMNYKVKLNLR